MPAWRGAKPLCALSRGTYWFRVMRSALGARRRDFSVVRDEGIGAAPWLEMGLGRMLVEAGIDPERDAVDIALIPGTLRLPVNIGVTAAEALTDDRTDGLSANGIGAELAVRHGVGTRVADLRRRDGPCHGGEALAPGGSDPMEERSRRPWRNRFVSSGIANLR